LAATVFFPAAFPGFGQIYTSADSGATWTATDALDTNYWVGVRTSADGSRLAAGLNPGGIFTARLTPTPQLNISRTGQNALVSWTIPSGDFALQQSSDMATNHWEPVANPPTTNLTNLQYQSIVIPASGSEFYRLASP
jgi:hypothetical protein